MDGLGNRWTRLPHIIQPHEWQDCRELKSPID